MHSKAEIGKMLLQLRQKSTYTKSEVGRNIGVKRFIIRDYEAGLRNFDLGIIISLLHFYTEHGGDAKLTSNILKEIQLQLLLKTYGGKNGNKLLLDMPGHAGHAGQQRLSFTQW